MSDIIAKWDALTPRERDAWVAEKVMGWTRGDEKRGDMPWYPHGKTRLTRGGVLNCPAFTTDPAAMMEVVERMYSMGYWIYIHYNPMDSEPESIRGIGVEIANRDKFPTEWVHRDTAPDAVALAALLAVAGGEG